MKLKDYFFSALLLSALPLCSCTPENTAAAVETVDTTSAAATANTSDTAISTGITQTSVSSVKTESAAAENVLTTTTAAPPENSGGTLTVHFLDVGQGDSIFIELPNDETMLIDAGEAEYGDKVVTYVYSQGYDTLNYVIATHPHSDHIGGMTAVLNSFNVGGFYTTSATSTTVTYEQMLSALEQNGAATKDVKAGAVILESGSLLVEVVAPKELDNDNQNNNSAVVKLTYGDMRFLFAGDAEKSEEDGIWTNIKCDVLKIGHHGSSTSTSDNFLKKVNPTYAVISCGLGNSYGHPSDKVLKLLADRNIKTYRTDLQGTIIFTSDGTDISVDKSPSVYEMPVTTTATAAVTAEQDTANSTTTYILNTNTKKFHYPSCSSVNDMAEKNKREYTGSRDEIIKLGYSACQRCMP